MDVLAIANLFRRSISFTRVWYQCERDRGTVNPLKFPARYVSARTLVCGRRTLLVGDSALSEDRPAFKSNEESGAHSSDFMDARTYHICSGRSKENAVQLEVARGIGNAYDLMIKIAARSPGSYFIVCSKTKNVCGSIDTSERQHAR